MSDFHRSVKIWHFDFIYTKLDAKTAEIYQVNHYSEQFVLLHAVSIDNELVPQGVAPLFVGHVVENVAILC